MPESNNRQDAVRHYIKCDTAQARAYSQAVVTKGDRILWLAGQVAQRAGRDPGQIRPRDRHRELVKFGQPVWYRFSFKIAGDWPQDLPAAGRKPWRGRSASTCASSRTWPAPSRPG